MAESATKPKPRRKPSTAKQNGDGGAPSTPSPTFPIDTIAAANEHLQRPFTRDAVKIKPQATAERDGKMVGLVTFYVDSRLVVERLNTVVGAGNWGDTYRLLCDGRDAPGLGFPVECALTVCGVTHVDVGQIDPSGKPDNKSWKSAYSDALKRAAVKFRIGAYLYGTPNVWAECKVGRNGKAQGFSDAGRKVALDAYDKWLKAQVVPVLGQPLDHGDVASGEVVGEAPENGHAPEYVPANQPEAKPAASPTPADTSVYCTAAEDAQLVARLLTACEAIDAKDAALGALAKHRADHDGHVKREWLAGQVERAEEAAALQNGTPADDKPKPCAECGGNDAQGHEEGCSNDIPF